METKDLSNGSVQPENGAEANVNNDGKQIIDNNETAKNKATEQPIVKPVAVATPGDDEHGIEPSFKVIDSDDNAQVEVEDYSGLSRQELLAKLNELINSFQNDEIRDAVEEIKSCFYKSLKTETAEAREKFIEEGGNAEDFKFTDDGSEDTFKTLYDQYREHKAAINQKHEAEKAKNLEAKLKIIDEIGELINKEESINKTFQEFRELQQRWRDIGLVPQNEVKGLWESYNHNVEKFYDYIKINKELRDLDLKHNLELKIELCEKAESLLLEESVTRAFKLLQDYHNQWREIGPVPAEQKEDIWERFKATTSQINKKHQDYFESLKDQQIKNLEQKTALCEKVEQIVTEGVEKASNWEEKSNEIIEIQKIWRTIGFAPKKDNNKIYHRFKTACDSFFAQKREFYKDAKEEQKNNMQLKLDLCVQAEALKDSTEWKKTTEDFVKLQKRWKEIGPVPRKHSDILWKRFRSACDFFFKVKNEHFSTIDSKQEENLAAKEELISKVAEFKIGADEKASLKELMDLQKQWSDIGHVPINKKDDVQKRFRDAINKQFEAFTIETGERNKMNFKNKVEGWVSSNSRNKIYSERNKLVTKIKELENEVALYENNMGFFSKSSNSDALIADINRKITRAKENIEQFKEKLKMMDNIDENS